MTYWFMIKVTTESKSSDRKSKLSKLKLDKKLKLTVKFDQQSKLLNKQDKLWHAISHNYRIKWTLGQKVKIMRVIMKVKIDIQRKLWDMKLTKLMIVRSHNDYLCHNLNVLFCNYDIMTLWPPPPFVRNGFP